MPRFSPHHRFLALKFAARGFAVSALMLCAIHLSACSQDNSQAELNPIPAPAQRIADTPTAAAKPKKAALGDTYIEALKPEERTAAAAAAEKYIKEKTKSVLDSLELNPESEFWKFPEDLNEFNKVGRIIVFDAYVNGNKEKPYRIVLVRSSDTAKNWDVKRFRADNKSIHQ